MASRSPKPPLARLAAALRDIRSRAARAFGIGSFVVRHSRPKRLAAGRVAQTGPGAVVFAKTMQFAGKLRETKMCFVAGTLVLTSQGLLAIERVEPGMEVLARCETTMEEGWKPVVQTFKTHPTELFTLGIDLSGDGDADEEIVGTGEHLFWVEDLGRFLPMRDLRPGMRLSLAEGRGSAVVAGNVSQRGPPGEAFTTYNFEVEDFHTYFVGESGVWVHNTGRAPCEKAFSIYHRFLDRESGDYWRAYERSMTRFPDTLNGEIKLRVFNEARQKYFAEAAGGIQPPWMKLDGQTLGRGGDPTTLGKNLEAVGVTRPGPGSVAAHHIVAHGDNRAVNVRAILQNEGIDIDEAANGVFLPRSSKLAEQMPELGPPHSRIHTNAYYDALEDRLINAAPGTVRNELQKIAAEMISGDFPW